LRLVLLTLVLFFLEADNDTDKDRWIRALDNIGKTPIITVFGLVGRETTTYSEWLFKSGGKTNAGFKRRWCVIKGNIFYYYEHQNDIAPKGVWDLSGCELGRIKERDGATRFRWKVTLKEDSLARKTKEERILHTDTSDKRERWLKVFVEAGKVVLNVVDKSPPLTMSKQSQPNLDIDNKTPELPASKAPLRKPERAGGAKIPEEAEAAGQKKRKDKEPGTRVIGMMDDSPSLLTRSSFVLIKKDEVQEITEFVSPRPASACYFHNKLYDTRDIEKERNAEALKSGRMLSLDEEWEEGENDWISGDEDDDEEQCVVM